MDTDTDFHIRQATAEDEVWVTDLMERVLAPYYDGDHRAHARRIFQAHLAGGHDTLGFFSHEQRMFIAESAEQRVGVIHVVGKRQGTYKISPLIVAEDLRGSRGIGRRLLAHAESYARSRGARQMYCTVAEGNRSAMQFFLRHRFVVAGSSDSHYKSGSKEVMLYKPLHEDDAIALRDQTSISVTPFQEQYGEQVKSLIMRELPEGFDGIDGVWIEALFAGYRRRHTADVTAKYKLMFVATDSSGTVLGMAAATPKKGTPIKLMPLIASSHIAFEALLSDLPHQLASYGHKLYVHHCPTVPQVMTLQRLGWKLDAAMPGAYRPDVVTQQWSLDVGRETMRTVRLKKRFLDQVRSGRKTLEVRVGYDSIKDIEPGECIRLVAHDETFVVRVTEKRQYPSFAAMLDREPYGAIVPDAASAEEVLAVLKGFYDDEKERLGVYVLEFRPG